ncbi:hypothetical protein KP509_32G061000 [Ceratopteris richardii]|uniref:NAC domain-containing protein n=1 Tax=Ceratopteris richardii TaxID=49495 RepID=A0A8T2QVH2_CERRI|nr:hypothetical protein KP509_32G061000 [Ceratopteris richardii]
MRSEMGKDPTRAPSSQLNLPPGFRFYPTDEELCIHYLCKKAASEPFTIPIIAEIELYKFDPWDLPERALFGEKEWYFFSPRDRKYPNGSRPNRAAGTGYWKATGTDKPIHGVGGSKVGVKKALVFYTGKAPKGMKTNWIMHEYRLADNEVRRTKRKGTLRLDDWVLCRIYKKCSGGGEKSWADCKDESESSCLEILSSPKRQNNGDQIGTAGIARLSDVDDNRAMILQNVYHVSPPPDCYKPLEQQLHRHMLSSTLVQAFNARAAPNVEIHGSSSADLSNSEAPSNPIRSGKTSNTSDDAAESNSLSQASFSFDHVNPCPQPVYHPNGALGTIPNPTRMFTQGAFPSLMDNDYGNLFGSNDYISMPRPICKPSVQPFWDPSINLNSYRG